jgi:hypothetical protein
MVKHMPYLFITAAILLSSCKKDDKVPGDLRHLMGFKDSHWIVDSIRRTGTTFSGGQNIPYTDSLLNPNIFEFHSSSEQVVIVTLDANGKSISRAPCSFQVIDNDKEAQIAFSYSAPNRYDVIASATNQQHWRMTKAKNPGLIYTEDYFMHRKNPL